MNNNQETWQERFDVLLNDYFITKESGIDEIKSFISQEIDTVSKVSYLQGYKDAGKINIDGEVVKNGRVGTYEDGVRDTVKEILKMKTSIVTCYDEHIEVVTDFSLETYAKEKGIDLT
jgi:hypothetical protein